MMYNHPIMRIVAAVMLLFTSSVMYCAPTLSGLPLSKRYSYDSAHFMASIRDIARSGALGRISDSARGIILREAWIDTILHSPDLKYSFGIIGLRVETVMKGNRQSSELYGARYLLLEHEDSGNFFIYPVSNEETFFADTSQVGVIRMARAWLYEEYDVDRSSSKPSLWKDPRMRKRPRARRAPSSSMKEHQQLGRYAVGQTWRYHNRSSEDSSRLTIVKILRSEEHGELYVIYIIGLRLKNPNHQQGVQSLLPHVVVSRESLDGSVTQLVDSNASIEKFLEDYNRLKGMIERGVSPMYTEPVADVITSIEKVMNQPRRSR